MNSLLKNVDTSGKIRALMAMRNLTQAKLAALLGVTDETIRNRLAANRWDVKDLEKIAEACDLDPRDLI